MLQFYMEVNEGAQIQEKELERSVDVREYFAITKFQKKAESLDPDKSHEWSKARMFTLMAEDNYGVVAVGELADWNEEKPIHQILIAEKTNDGTSNSALVDGLSQNTVGNICGVLSTVIPCLPSEIRYEYVRKIIGETQEYKTEDNLTERLSREALEMLPDFLNHPEMEAMPVEWGVYDEEKPTEEQLKQLSGFVELLKNKMSWESFNQQMEKYLYELKSYDRPYSKTYNFLYTDMTNMVLNDRLDTERRYDILQREEPLAFSVKDKVTRKIENDDQLKEVLGAMPVERVPNIHWLKRGTETAEMVDMEKVVGGPGIESWAVISDSEYRGFGNIKHIIKGFLSGEITVTGKNMPISLLEYQGKYYIDGDGRHRTAALKALGVAQAPALVVHYT